MFVFDLGVGLLWGLGFEVFGIWGLGYESFGIFLVYRFGSNILPTFGGLGVP